MPTVERRSLPQSLSAVALKGRRLFARDPSSTLTEWQAKAPTSLRASALNLNEALEQCWSVASSPHCLSNQLRSPQLSDSLHIHSWGKDFGRRRSSNTTTTSTSSTGPAQETLQRRRKSLFSKKPRPDQTISTLTEDCSQNNGKYFVDPFAEEAYMRPSRKPLSEPCAVVPDARSYPATGRSIQRHSTQLQEQQQQQKKKEALDRVSNLVCLSVQNQTQLPRYQVGASSPTFQSASPALCDGYFYPLEPPPSPTSLPYNCDRGSNMVAFPMHAGAWRGLRLTVGNHADGSGDSSSTASPSLSSMSTTADLAVRDHPLEASGITAENKDPQNVCWLPPAFHTDGTAFSQNQILLPSSMTRRPGRRMDLDAGKKSSGSLRAEVGHGYEVPNLSPMPPRFSSISQHRDEWSVSEESRPSLRPLPPLRPSRNPLRSRSKSLSAAIAVGSMDANALQNRPSNPRPRPPLPSPPYAESKSGMSGLVTPDQMTPLHTPPRSKRSSMHRPQRDRYDSWASAASAGSPQGAPFHTPTFGSARWTTLPVS